MSRRYRCAILSAVKHDYVARGMATHPRFEMAVVADDPGVPAWAHERNQWLADHFRVPYVRDVEAALRDHDVQVAIVSPEAERHCDLSIRAARAGKHVVQDKPLATHRADADRLLSEIETAGVRFLMWNRNFIPAIEQTRQVVGGTVGRVRAVHVDFYFAKDAGPPLGSRQPGYPPMDWLAHQIAAHVDGSDGGLGREPMGELAIEAIYPLGYIHRLTGEAAVRRVFARATAHFHQLYADNGVEDLASLSLEMDGGIIGSVAVGRIGAASHPGGGEIRLHVVGTEGALVIDESSPGVTVCYRGQPPNEPRRKRVGNDNDFRLADDFARAIETGSDPGLGIRASHAIFATVEAALRSGRSGQVEEVR